MSKDTESGFTLIELVVSMSLAGFVSALAILNIKAFDNPLLNGSAEISSFLKQVRAKAMGNTRAYHVTAANSTRIIARYADTCSDTTLVDDSLAVLDLPSGTHLTDITWDVCFTSRGLSNADVTIPVTDADGATKSVEVVLGGAVRIL